MTTSATGSGRPRCRLIQRRIDGPSLSRKKVLKIAKESVKNTEVRPLIPSARPLTSVLPAPDRALGPIGGLRGVVRADPGVLEPPLDLGGGRVEGLVDLVGLRGQPTEDEQDDEHADDHEPEQHVAAPPARGTPRRWSLATMGPATAAQTQPRITGTVIEAVSPRSHTRPIRTAPTPTSSHIMNPRSRSHLGALKRSESCAGSMSSGEPPPRPPRRPRVRECVDAS